jgi:hypothetical protein
MLLAMSLSQCPLVPHIAQFFLQLYGFYSVCSIRYQWGVIGLCNLEFSQSCYPVGFVFGVGLASRRSWGSLFSKIAK